MVTTVQSLLFNNKYQSHFSPTDFNLVISDEAHRSIGGNSRAVFEYFIGYKLGLTATPKDYLKKFDPTNPTTRDPREAERRLLMDTYRTFGCEDSQPTFRYSLLDGVKDGFLINPTVVDARTDVTTQLLSEEGFIVETVDGNGDTSEESYEQRQFEKKFFSPETDKLFCKTFLENALRDPVSKEIGKSIVFAVSQNHAAKLTQILNEMADRMFPGKYQSDFAVQVTSSVDGAQQHTINFTNNKLLGSANFLDTYKTSKARVCVTVGMMTTGYDLPGHPGHAPMRPVVVHHGLHPDQGPRHARTPTSAMTSSMRISRPPSPRRRRSPTSSSISSPTANSSGGGFLGDARLGWHADRTGRRAHGLSPPLGESPPPLAPGLLVVAHPAIDPCPPTTQVGSPVPRLRRRDDCQLTRSAATETSGLPKAG